jgi:hypothetical protein
MDQGTRTYTGTSTPFSVAGGILTSARQPEINAVVAEMGTIRCQVPATAGVGTTITLAALDQTEQVRFTPGSSTVSANGLQLDLAEIPILRPFMVQRQNADSVSYADVESVTLGKGGEVRVVDLP